MITAHMPLSVSLKQRRLENFHLGTPKPKSLTRGFFFIWFDCMRTFNAFSWQNHFFQPANDDFAFFSCFSVRLV